MVMVCCWCTLCNDECFVVIAPVEEDRGEDKLISNFIRERRGKLLISYLILSKQKNILKRLRIVISFRHVLFAIGIFG